MEALRKKLGPKKEVPKKIQISPPTTLISAVPFGPGKIPRYAEPDFPDENDWRTKPFAIPPHPSYSERTDRPAFKDEATWKKSLKKRSFKLVIPPQHKSTFQSNFAYSTPFQFCEEEHEPPRKAPTYEEQLARYPPTHEANGFLIHPSPKPSGYVPFHIQQALLRSRALDQGVPVSHLTGPRTESLDTSPKAGPSAPTEPPRLCDVLKRPAYEDFSVEQQKDLLPPAIQLDRHAKLRQKLTEERALKNAKEMRQPLEGGFASNSASTPAAPIYYQKTPENALISPAKLHDQRHTRSASVSHGGSQTTKVHNVPAPMANISKFKFGLGSRFKGGPSSHCAVVDNPSSTPLQNTKPIDYSKEPLPSLPRRPRAAVERHARTGSRDAVYYTAEEITRSGKSQMRSRGSIKLPIYNPEPIHSRKEPTDSTMAPQKPQESDSEPPSHVRSGSSSKRYAGLGLPPTSPLRVHKRNASNPVEPHSVLDYASVTTSRAGPQGPPPVMRHRALLDSVIKRPGRLESLPISARSKNAKEEYFTPPPRRLRIDSTGRSYSRLDGEFGVLPPSDHFRNVSTSAATAPSRLRPGFNHGHSQSLTDKGLPAHPAVHLQERKIRRTKLQNN